MRGALVYEATFCQAQQEQRGWVIFCPHKFQRHIILGHISSLRHIVLVRHFVLLILGYRIYVFFFDDFSLKNIATGETSQAITPNHFFDYFNFSDF